MSLRSNRTLRSSVNGALAVPRSLSSLFDRSYSYKYPNPIPINDYDKCLSNIKTVLQNKLEIVSEWLVDNKLSLHLGKTESILFGSRPRLKSQPVLSITCKGTIIEAKNTVKYLGVVLEQCISDANWRLL